MIQRRRRASFLHEPLQAFRIRRAGRRQNLDGDDAIQPRIPRPIHFAHASRAEQGLDVVRAQFRSCSDGHLKLWIISDCPRAESFTPVNSTATTATFTAAATAALTGAASPSAVTITGTAAGSSSQQTAVNTFVNPAVNGGAGTAVDLSAAYNLFANYTDAEESTITPANSLDGVGYACRPICSPSVTSSARYFAGGTGPPTAEVHATTLWSIGPGANHPGRVIHLLTSVAGITCDHE